MNYQNVIERNGITVLYVGDANGDQWEEYGDRSRVENPWLLGDYIDRATPSDIYSDAATRSNFMVHSHETTNCVVDKVDQNGVVFVAAYECSDDREGAIESMRIARRIADDMATLFSS